MYVEFFLEVVRRTAVLVAQWQCVGFCHGFVIPVVLINLHESILLLLLFLLVRSGARSFIVYM